MKQTMKEAGYKFMRRDGSGKGAGYVLKEIDSGNLEIWYANKGHASYGIIYGNTELEFARSIS